MKERERRATPRRDVEREAQPGPAPIEEYTLTPEQLNEVLQKYGPPSKPRDGRGVYAFPDMTPTRKDKRREKK
jgi:hypothetical protein